MENIYKGTNFNFWATLFLRNDAFYFLRLRKFYVRECFCVPVPVVKSAGYVLSSSKWPMRITSAQEGQRAGPNSTNLTSWTQWSNLSPAGWQELCPETQLYGPGPDVTHVVGPLVCVFVWGQAPKLFISLLNSFLWLILNPGSVTTVDYVNFGCLCEWLQSFSPLQERNKCLVLRGNVKLLEMNVHTWKWGTKVSVKEK